MQRASDSAHNITADLLERSGEAFLSGDLDTFASCIALPWELETFEGKRQIESEVDLGFLFNALQTHHRKYGVTQIARNVVEAVFKDDLTILATFETRLLNGNLLTQKPYPVFAVIIRTDTGWKTKSMTFAIEDQPEHNALLMGTAPTTSG